jgi:dihydrofolate synthase / folylpolyglutamate synthase
MELHSLTAWLTWLEQHHPSEIDLGLDRIRAVAQRMDLLTTSALVVTVAGTNGKGSCVAATAALLQQAGHKVGVYTSPHLLYYNERIVVDGKQATDTEICAAFAAIYRACYTDTANSISLTYFEYGTLAALFIFREYQATALVLEVGMGGRLDATNILDADVTVITSIDLDHTQWLGDTREAIGVEKAGIMRKNKPIVCADFSPPQSIINRAAELQSPLYLITRDFGYNVADNQCALSWIWWTDNTEFQHQPLPQLPLPSVAAALQVATLLKLPMSAATFLHLAQLRVSGRFQEIHWRDRRVILDVAHNPAAVAFFVKNLLKKTSVPVHMLIGMMADKDRERSLAHLKNCVSHWYVVDLSPNLRAASVQQMQDALNRLGVEPIFSGVMKMCLEEAYTRSQLGDTLVILGSFYTVSAALMNLS